MTRCFSFWSIEFLLQSLPPSSVPINEVIMVAVRRTIKGSELIMQTVVVAHYGFARWKNSHRYHVLKKCERQDGSQHCRLLRAVSRYRTWSGSDGIKSSTS